MESKDDHQTAIKALELQIAYEKQEWAQAKADAKRSFDRYLEQDEKVRQAIKRIACLNDSIEQLSKTTLVQGGADHA